MKSLILTGMAAFGCFAFLIALFMGVLCSLLGAHIAMDIAKLYDITFILNSFTFAKMYGFMIIASLFFITMGTKLNQIEKAVANIGMSEKEAKDTELKRALVSISVGLFSYPITLLCSWAMAYIVSWIIL